MKGPTEDFHTVDEMSQIKTHYQAVSGNYHQREHSDAPRKEQESHIQKNRNKNLYPTFLRNLENNLGECDIQLSILRHIIN